MRAPAIVIAGVLVVGSLTVSAPADAATHHTNWLRACSTVKSRPVSTACLDTPPAGGYRSIRYRDTHGKAHTIHRPSTAWTWLRKHSKKCVPFTNQRSCYGIDEVMGKRMFADANGRHVWLSRLR